MCASLRSFTWSFLFSTWKSAFFIWGLDQHIVLEPELHIVTLFWPLGPHILTVLFDWCCSLEPLAKVGHSPSEACLGLCTHCFPRRATRPRNAFYKAAVGLLLVSLKLNIWPRKTFWLTWYYIFWDIPILTQRLERSSKVLLSDGNSKVYMTCPTDIWIWQDGVAAIPSQETLCSIPEPEAKALALSGPWLADFP